MWKDPIVEEVRRIREELAAKYDFDINAIFDAAMKRQRRSKRKVVSFERKKNEKPLKDLHK